jgi:3-hydroxybutyryl-CoA dehydrogenase
MSEDNSEIASVGILGAGTIGASWAALFLASGYEVAVYDTADSSEAYVHAYIERAWPVLKELGLAKANDKGKIAFVDTAESVVECSDFVQESVPERLNIKHALFRRIEPYLRPRAILASSASGLMVKEMQEGLSEPSRLIVAHPFNPPHLIPLVELVANERTATGVIERAEAFYGSCARVTIRVQREVPGHVANRLQAALWREAIHLVNEGVATVEDVDKAVWAGPGLRWAAMGPHMLFSLGSGGQGLSVFCERYSTSFHRWWDDLGAPRLTPEIAAKLVRGVAHEERGRSFDSIADERDRLIVAMLKASRAKRNIG